MLTWKIISILCVFILSYIGINQKKRSIKWTSIVLCAIVSLIGLVDLVISESDKKEFQREILRSNTRIEWDKSEAILNIGGNIEDFVKGRQQVVFKVFPANLEELAAINVADIVSRASDYGYRRKYLNEADAKQLWHVFTKENGVTFVSDESERGIEHINFYEESLKKGHFSGVNSIQKVAFEPRSVARYNSLQDLNNTIIIARYVTHTEKNVTLKKVDLNLRTKAGPETLSFPAKAMINGKVVYDQVRYVGIIVGKNEFNRIAEGI